MPNDYTDGVTKFRGHKTGIDEGYIPATAAAAIVVSPRKRVWAVFTNVGDDAIVLFLEAGKGKDGSGKTYSGIWLEAKGSYSISKAINPHDGAIYVLRAAGVNSSVGYTDVFLRD